MVEATDAHVSNEFSTPVDGLSHASNTVVTDSLETGEATYRGYYSTQIQTAYVVTGPESNYHRVTITEHDRAETTGYEYSVEIGDDESTLSNDDLIHHFAELPAQDRQSILSAIRGKERLHAPHYTSFSVVFAYEYDEEREQSVFIPDSDVHYVEWEDTLLRLKFDEQRSVQITSYTVATELVAESLEEFVEHLREERGVILDDLTMEQHGIVTQAIDGGYNDCKPYSDSFTDLLDRLSKNDRNFAPLVRYGTVWYFTHVTPI